ncbi:unnamed protein product [Rotaria sp. Silwood2]|nr:unnamed protein product [Rotaria sp. Silwood2]
MLRVGRVNRDLCPIEIPENHEEVICLIWLDSNMDNSKDSFPMQETLLELNSDVRLCTEVNLCIDLIKTLIHKRIVIIVCGDLSCKIVPEIHGFRSIVAIHIFCINREFYEPLMAKYEKIVEIFSDRQSLLESICETISFIEKQIYAFNLFGQKQKSVRDPPRGSASFLWHHLLIYVLRQLPQDEQSKKDMLDKCIDYYQDNKRELKKIQQFRQMYTSDKAIQWYTHDCFLYRLLNKALRTEDIDLLYSFRFFIIDLCNQLENNNYERKSNKTISTLYRGQRISKEEFERLQKSVGLLISTNGFLSTSRDITISLVFAGPGITNNNDQYSVLFVINVPVSLKRVIFADVHEQSEIPSEQEVLFSHGATFRMNSVDFDSNLNTWKVVMTVTDEGLDNVQEYKLLLDELMQDQSSTVLFGAFLWRDMEYIEHAKKFFDELLVRLPSDHSDLPFIYNYIGTVYYEKGEFNLALEYYQKAYKYRQERLSSDHPNIIASLHNIGNIYCEKGDFDQAIDYYYRALMIDNKHYIDTFPRAAIYEALGNLFRKKCDSNNALIWLNRAYNMYTRLLPSPHPHIARCIGNIGLVHEANRNLDRALEYFFEEFEMEEQCLPPDHPNLSMHLDWIITMYREKGEWERILRYFRVKTNTTKHKFVFNRRHLASTLQAMKDFSPDATKIYTKHYELSMMNSLTRTLEIASVKEKSDALTTNRCIRRLSVCSVDEQKLEKNLTYWIHALNIERRVYSSDHPEIVRSLRWVGESHIETIRDYSEALRMYSERLRSFAKGSANFKDIECGKYTDFDMNDFERKFVKTTI